MAKSTRPNSQARPNTGPGKKPFPLRLHGNGQWCKKIRGKRIYFGTDKDEAETKYHEFMAKLLKGEVDVTPASGVAKDKPQTIRQAINEYLHYQNARVKTGEITETQYSHVRWHMQKFAQRFGAGAELEELETIVLQDYRTELVEAGQAPTSINNRMGAIKAMFHWCFANGRIARRDELNLDAIKKIRVERKKRQVFTPEQIKDLLAVANTNMKAMIWLGLNCGLGCTDCAELTWGIIDAQPGRLVYPRTKTGAERNLKLWPQTIAALEAVRTWSRAHGRNTSPYDLVFRTKQGHAYVRLTVNALAPDSAISKEFAKLLREAKIPKEAGTGFYSLRRTGATLTAKSKDVFAVKGYLGHIGLEMATWYVQQDQLSLQTDQATDHTQELITPSELIKTPGNSAPPSGPAPDEAGGSAAHSAPGQKV